MFSVDIFDFTPLGAVTWTWQSILTLLAALIIAKVRRHDSLVVRVDIKMFLAGRLQWDIQCLFSSTKPIPGAKASSF